MSMPANGLAKLIEELGELSQVAGKKLAYYRTDEHPDGVGSLKLRLEQEIGDVWAATKIVIDNFGLDEEFINARAANKLKTFRGWHASDSNATDAYVPREPT